MKRKIKITGLDGKVLEKEIKVRDLDHLRACLKYKFTITKPKKGKGSYKRVKKVKINEEFD